MVIILLYIDLNGDENANKEIGLTFTGIWKKLKTRAIIMH